MPESKEGELGVRVVPFSELDTREVATLIDWKFEDITDSTRGQHYYIQTREGQGYYAGMAIWSGHDQSKVMVDCGGVGETIYLYHPENVEFNEAQKSVKVVGENGKYIMLSRDRIEFTRADVKFAVDFSKAKVELTNPSETQGPIL